MLLTPVARNRHLTLLRTMSGQPESPGTMAVVLVRAEPAFPGVRGEISNERSAEKLQLALRPLSALAETGDVWAARPCPGPE